MYVSIRKGIQKRRILTLSREVLTFSDVDISAKNPDVLETVWKWKKSQILK